MRILISEDDARISHALKKGLEMENYAVDISSDGTDTFDLASSEDYDLIILDLMLPGMDGITITKKLRDKNIHTPILMLTAKSQMIDKISGLNMGADDYMVKPFSFEELLARIRALLRRPQNTIKTNLTYNDLTLDIDKYMASRNKTNIILSRKEFSLLEYLMRNKGRTISKDQIIQHVWDYDSDVLPNTVEVYIKKLREKIDKVFPKSPELIKTIRGFGYKFGE